MSQIIRFPSLPVSGHSVPPTEADHLRQRKVIHLRPRKEYLAIQLRPRKVYFAIQFRPWKQIHLRPRKTDLK